MKLSGRILFPLFLAAASALIFPFALMPQSTDTPTKQEASTTGSGLRDVFLGKESQPSESPRTVGRLGVFLEGPGGYNQVRHDYAFHSGDHFRFEITANQDGWLYVLHTSPEGKVQQLWPSGKDTFAVRHGQTYNVPPRPGVFIFDKEAGQELFYIAIRRDRKLPVLGEATSPQKISEAVSDKPERSAVKPTTRITNFAIRDPFGETTRGVTFDPGQGDADLYLYFSALPQDSTKSAMLEFQLSHVQ